VPLLTLEYTANIAQEMPLPDLFATLHQVLSDLTGIPLDNFKSRAVRRDHFYIGAGEAGNAFVHLEIRVLAGRPLPWRQRIGQEALRTLEAFFAPSTEELDLQITVEVADIERETYFKIPENLSPSHAPRSPDPGPTRLAITIEQATVDDAAEILALQKLAYLSEAAIHDDHTIPPLTQTLAEMQADFNHHLFLKATLEGRLVGSVRGRLQDSTCYAGRLIVDPEVQNRGLGTQLMHEIEKRFRDAGRYELFTGHRSERNLHLYAKLGYREFCREVLTDKVTLVFMEKHNG
jgi:5-carboxymethyl-2-hydroxymuconate isomerase/GNAT superfamily N-acetyltransferase